MGRSQETFNKKEVRNKKEKKRKKKQKEDRLVVRMRRNQVWMI